MDLDEKRFILDVLGKEIELLKSDTDIVHKKLLVFLGSTAGSWFYIVKFAESENYILYVFAVLFLFVFLISVIAIFTNILRLSKNQQEIKSLKGKLNDIL
jgi:hypothetical protein